MAFLMELFFGYTVDMPATPSCQMDGKLGLRLKKSLEKHFVAPELRYGQWP